MISPDNLIPPDSELGQLLAQWSEDQDSRTWHIADVTNDLIEELEGGGVTKIDVYRAVAARCRGREPNTIRRLAEVAKDFDPDVREKYEDLLSFNHFKIARRLQKEGYAPSAEYALQWCVEGNDMKLSAGRFHTAGDMLRHFLPPDTFENQLQKYWSRVKEKLYDLMLIHEHDVQRKAMIENWVEIDAIISALDTVKEV